MSFDICRLAHQGRRAAACSCSPPLLVHGARSAPCAVSRVRTPHCAMHAEPVPDPLQQQQKASAMQVCEAGTSQSHLSSTPAHQPFVPHGEGGASAEDVAMVDACASAECGTEQQLAVRSAEHLRTSSQPASLAAGAQSSNPSPPASAAAVTSSISRKRPLSCLFQQTASQDCQTLSGDTSHAMGVHHRSLSAEGQVRDCEQSLRCPRSVSLFPVPAALVLPTDGMSLPALLLSRTDASHPWFAADSKALSSTTRAH